MKPTAEATEDDSFDDLIRELADAVYLSRKQPYSPELVQKTADKLIDAVSEGYGDLSIDWDTPDHEMVEKLVENVFSFSAAKSYQELRDMTLALVDDKGRVRSFEDFEAQVIRMGYTYNRNWLRTEYDTAIGSAIMAARWVQYMREADTFPMLRYATVGDDRVRPDHELLNGIIRHILSEFWKIYYPPNGWGCRCDVEQEPGSDAHETDLPPILPDIHPMFKTNLAETGLLFPKDHPYYNGVPKDILRRAMQYIPEDYAFRTKNGFEEHAMLQYEPEASENRQIAKVLSDSGEKDIRLMPRLHEKETELREKIYGSGYIEKHSKKCPDCFIGQEAAEFKESGRANMSKRVLEASRQADIVVLRATEPLTEEYIERFVNGQWAHSDRLNVKRIIIVSDETVYKYDRP